MPSAIAIGFLMVMAIPSPEDDPKTPREQFQALKRDYDAAFQAFAAANHEAKREAEIAKVRTLNPRSFASGFMALAKRYPGTGAAGNTWRCVWDGDYEGPINTAWNIREYPTIYVLDPEGVIRYKNVFGKDLERAVDSLLEEMRATNRGAR